MMTGVPWTSIVTRTAVPPWLSVMFAPVAVEMRIGGTGYRPWTKNARSLMMVTDAPESDCMLHLGDEGVVLDHCFVTRVGVLSFVR